MDREKISIGGRIRILEEKTDLLEKEKKEMRDQITKLEILCDVNMYAIRTLIEKLYPETSKIAKDQFCEFVDHIRRATQFN